MTEPLDDAPWRPPTVDRPVATFMVVAAIVVFGWVSLERTPVDLMPELSYPTITVRTDYPGAAPEEVEDAITRPIEELLGTVEGLVGMTSVSRAGGADVVFRFQWDTPLDDATQKVRERLSLVDLPDGASNPLILRYDPALDPILTLAVVGDVPPEELRRYVEDEVKGELERVRGVAMVRVSGGTDAVVRIDLIESRLASFGLDARAVVERLRAENINVAGGELVEGQTSYLVRTLNEFQSLDDLGRTAVALRGTAVVWLDDVAEIRRDVREASIVTRVDGRDSVQIAVYKDADANLVETAGQIARRVFGDGDAAANGSGEPDRDGSAAANGSGEPDRDGSAAATADAAGEAADEGADASLAADAPGGITFEVLTDQSIYVRASITEVQQTALMGGIWAVVVLFVFLRQAYATFVIGLAIPLSVLATFAPLRQLGLTLNVMSLGGLALGIGMLVDNAVVVLESIVRCREEGDSPRDAAIRGTGEVAGAVIASTLTTVAVFFPIAFVEGIAGQLFGDLAMTVVLSLLASLGFALLFVPMMTLLPDTLAASAAAGTDSEATMAREQLRLWSWESLRSDLRGALTMRPRVLAPVVAIYTVARTVVWLPVEVAARIVAIALLGLRWLLRTLGAGLVAGGRGILALPLGAFAWAFDAFTRGYGVVVRGAVRGRWWVLAASAASLVWAFAASRQLGMQLMPELQQGVFVAQVRMPVGTRLEQTSAVLARVESRLVASDDVARVSTFIGRDENDLDASEQGEHYAELTVVVAGASEDPAAEGRAVDATRAAVGAEPAAELEIVRPTLFSLAAPIAVIVRGERLDLLDTTAASVEARMRATPGLTDVRSSAREGFPEVRVVFDRARLAALGITLRDAAEAVRAKVQGVVATQLRDGEHSVDVDVAVRRVDVRDLDALRNIVVAFDGGATTAAPGAAGATAPAGLDLAALGAGAAAGAVAGTGAATAGAPITLQSVAALTVARGPAEIRHVNGQRAAVVSAGSSVADLQRVVGDLQGRLADVRLMPSQTIEVAGQSEEMASATASLGFAFALAVFLVYVVMASTFESIVGPLVILLTIPLSLIGVVGALRLAAMPLSVIALIGLIVLVGIIVNNAIVLVDAVLSRERQGIPRAEAIADACTVRLRPVLITAATTVLGLLPMLVASGDGAELRRPLAAVLIAGLSVGTALTLVVIPAAYAAMMPRVSPVRR